jgi:hypothetical protein
LRRRAPAGIADGKQGFAETPFDPQRMCAECLIFVQIFSARPTSSAEIFGSLPNPAGKSGV